MDRQNIISKVQYTCLKRDGEKIQEERMNLKEFALDIYVNGEYLLTSVCTGEFLEELTLGRLKTEGIIESMEDLLELDIKDTAAYVAVKDDSKRIEPKELSAIVYPNEWVFAMADRMAEGMPYHNETWATHSCFLYSQGSLIFMCEDLGRHNAMDKAIGYAVKNKINLAECSVYTSGRVPSDMAMKAIMAGIPVLVSKGMPTQDTIQLVNQYKLTLISGARRDLVRIYADFRKKNVDAVILAGGKSSRMGGQHKGSLICGNETFTQHLINEAGKVADQIWLSYGKEVREEYAGCHIVKDEYLDCGPIGGIHAALKNAEADTVIVTACDMPFMGAEFFEMLLDQMEDGIDGVVPREADGRLHPLAAVYRKDILPVVEEQIQSENYRLRDMLAKVNIRYVEVEDKWLDMLRNVNTVEEYKNLI